MDIKLAFPLAAALLCSFPYVGSAAFIPPPQMPTTCAADTLAHYELYGEGTVLGVTEPDGCTLAGSTLFFGAFGFTPDPNLGINAGQIELTPAPAGEGGGFDFTQVSGNPFSVAAGQSLDFGINYDWRFTRDPWADAASLGLDPPSGDVLITEGLCVDPFTIEGNLDVGQGCAGGRYSFSVDDTNPPTSWSNTIDLFPYAANGENVSLTFQLGGANSPDSGFDALSATNDVVNVSSPEPVSAVLGLGGLIAVAIRRRYRNA